MANLFGSLFKKRGSGSVLGIDIGSSSIKIVQLRKKGGKAILETYGELALGPYAGVEIGQATSLPIGKIIEALSDLLKEKEVNISTNQCGVAIPFSSSLMAVMELPLLSFKQLTSMVPLEARKYIPVPISEVTLDWSVIPKEEVNTEEDEDDDKNAVAKIPKTDILLVAIHNETVAKYQEIVKKTGLEAGFLEIEIFSTMRSVFEEDHEPVMIADLGAATTKLYVIERGIVRFSHTINRGAQDVTSVISKSLGISIHDAELLKRNVGAIPQGDTDLREAVALSLGYIFAETNQVILNYQRKHNRTLSKILLVGGGSSLKGIKELAQDSFQIEVLPGNPFVKTEAPAFLEEVLRTTGPEFAVSVGIALRRLQEGK
jgi:type IV pilus assembly protein PilM